MSPTVLGLVALYAVSSASLLVLNKAAIKLVPEPALLLLAQVGSTAVFIAVPAQLGWISCTMVPERKTAIAFTLVSHLFLATIYTNIKFLQFVGVNAFIVLRCSTPLAVSVLDWIFMGRKLPDARSCGALAGVMGSAAVYVALKGGGAGPGISGMGMVWGALWFGTFLTDMIFIKSVVDSHPCNGMERALYQNMYCIPTLIALFMTGLDGSSAAELMASNTSLDALGLIMLGLSCVGGTVLSYAGLSLRSEVSSTAFAVIGVACKMASTALNEAFVEPEGNYKRLSAVVGVILFSSLYKQAPMREDADRPKLPQ